MAAVIISDEHVCERLKVTHSKVLSAANQTDLQTWLGAQDGILAVESVAVSVFEIDVEPEMDTLAFRNALLVQLDTYP